MYRTLHCSAKHAASDTRQKLHQPQPPQFTAALRLVSAANLSGTSPFAVDRTKHREPLHYTTDSGPVLYHATPAPILPTLFNTMPGHADDQFSQKAHQHLAASLHNGSLTDALTNHGFPVVTTNYCTTYCQTVMNNCIYFHTAVVTTHKTLHNPTHMTSSDLYLDSEAPGCLVCL